MDTQFTSCLPNTLLEGDKIVLEGYFKEDAERFSINLVCVRDDSEQEEPSDVVYNFELLFDEEGASFASFNCKQNGIWQTPIEKDNIPISRDEKFEITLVLIGSYGDLVICTYYNQFCYEGFNIRLPIENAKYSIEVGSGLRKMESIKFIFP